MKLVFRQRLLATTLFAGVALIAQSASAQTAPSTSPDEARPAQDVQTAPADAVADSQDDPGDEIVVTGSLIRNPNIEQSSPVTTVGEAEIELSQANVAEELLRELPAAVPSIGSQVNNGNGGASLLNLRGLGSNRNLVLLDGKRIVPANLTGATDLNNIPLSLLERVDVLTGGASTTYGADAVAGVVNFITKRDFAGADISLSQTINEAGDGNIFRADVTLGANFDDGRGNAVIALGYQQADPVFQGDRGFSNTSIDSTSGLPGGSGATVPTVFSLPGVGNRQIDAAGNLAPRYALFNFAPQNIFQTPFERFNVFGQGSYDLFDGVELYTEGLFSKQTVSTRIASSATFGTTLPTQIGNPFLTDSLAGQLAQFIDTNATLAGIQPPTAAQIAAARAGGGVNDQLVLTRPIQRRFVEAGTRNSDFTTTLFNVQVGVRGDVTENIGFDLFGTYGESENIQRQTGQGLRTRLLQAVDVIRDTPTGPIRCRDTSNGCSPLNLFGQAGSISQESIDFINVSTSASTLTSLGQIRGVLSGDLPIGSPFSDDVAGFATGGEYRRYRASRSSDVANQTPGEVLGNGGATPDVTGGYDVYEAFGELIVPLVTDKPFFKSLQLELGGRYSDYSSTGSAYTYKAAGQWEPVDGFKLRGSYNRATRSPNIGELFDPLVTQLDNLEDDPCQGVNPVNNPTLAAVCLAQGAPANTIGNISEPSAGQINVSTGGSLTVDVEKADTFTAGFVFQPNFIPGLAITADYYNIKIKDAISAPTIDDVLSACFGASPYLNPPTGAATSAACTSIRRNPLTGGLDGEQATTPGLPLPLSNLGTVKTSGVDLIATYRSNLGFIGGFLSNARLNLSFNGNWTNEQKFKATPTSINRECVGLYSVNCTPTGSPQPEFSFVQRSTVTLGGTSVSVLWRFVDDLRVEGGFSPVEGEGAGFLEDFSSIDEKHYFDLSLRQEVTDDVNLIFTVLNLFDNKPPLVGNGIGSTAYNSGNTFPSTYDPLGRRFAVQANLKF